MKDRIIVAIGGGELKSKETLDIDRCIANYVKNRCDHRPTGLFIGTASHDSMPYFNSFRKTYTSEFDVKADCALICYNEMNIEKISEKIQKADFIYVGGGDTVFMLEKWKKSGMLDLITDAYNKGTVLCGLSAGAICWFNGMYTDSESLNGNENYSLYNGLNILSGTCCPHYDERLVDFDKAVCQADIKEAYAIENLSALVFKNEKLQGSIGCGGSSYILRNNAGIVEKFTIEPTVL